MVHQWMHHPDDDVPFVPEVPPEALDWPRQLSPLDSAQSRRAWRPDGAAYAD